MIWLRQRTCRGCRHAGEVVGCTCSRQDCICRAGRRARYDQAVAALSPRDQEWLTVGRARLFAVLQDAGLDLSRLHPATLDEEHLSKVLASADIAQIRGILRHEVAEADDPRAMLRFLTSLIAPGQGPSTPD